MISLSVSEAFAYDMLAIASIKVAMNPMNGAAADNATQLMGEIKQQIGWQKNGDILASSEYADLYRVNREMYIRIDELKQREEQLGDARYIDDRVYRRFLAKQALQQRWFPAQPLTEQKMGYGEGKG